MPLNFFWDDASNDVLPYSLGYVTYEVSSYSINDAFYDFPDGTSDDISDDSSGDILTNMSPIFQTILHLIL